MERVTGIGGFFFRATDPAALGAWYQTHFGIIQVPESYGDSAWWQEAGTTVFAPFPADSDAFGRPQQSWMINLRVRDLDAMVAQLQRAGIAVEIDPEVYPNGRFASTHDPEGNPIQLWQPEDPDPVRPSPREEGDQNERAER